jgi:hypothetical protein
MTTNRLTNAFNAFLITGLLLAANHGFAQAPTYARTLIGSNRASTTTGQTIGRAHDGDPATAARITTATTLGLGDLYLSDEGYVEVRFGTSNLPANTTVYVKIGAEGSNQLDALVGGALGNLVGGLLFGEQGIAVTARTNGGTAVPIGNGSSAFSQNSLRLVKDLAGNFYIMVTPNGAFNRIRITNKVNGLVATRWLDFYEAFYFTGTGSCGLANYTSYSGAGLLSVGSTGAFNITNAIDGNAATFSTLSLGTLAVGAYVDQAIYFPGASTASDYYNIKFKIDPALLAIDVLGGVQIVGYNGTTEVYNKNLSDPAFLSLNLSTQIGAGNLVSLQIQPGAIDRLVIRLNAVANLSLALNQGLDIYEVNKGNFSVSVTGAGSYRVGQTATLTATATGCNSPYSYAWTGTPTPNSPNTATTTVPTTTPGTYSYSVTATDAYGNIKTATAQIVVEAPPVAGTIGGASSVCAGDIPGNLTLIGHVGNIIRWEKSATPGFTSFTTIDNTTAALAGSAIGPLSATTYIRAVIKHNSYDDVYTPAVALQVKSTTWDGNAWSNGVPDLSTAIIFTGNYNGTENLDGCTLEVSNNAVVTIASDKTVTLNKYINVAAGSSFTLQHNAHLVQLTNAVNQGNVNIKRNSSRLFRLDYTLWSAPVSGQQLRSFSPNTLANRFYDYQYIYDEGIGAYAEQYVVTDPTANFESAKSYLIRMPDQTAVSTYNNGSASMVFNGEFIGTPNNGPLTRALSTQGNRFTAIGNPYPSPINVHAFFDANQSVLQTGSALYFWRKKNNTNATSYATLTKDAFVSNNAAGGRSGEDIYGGAEWTSFFASTANTDWVLNPGQGFFVKTAAGATSPSVTFNNAMRRGNVHNSQFFRTAEADRVSRMWVNLTGENAFSQMAIVYSSTATLGLDFGRDGLQLGDGAVSIYTTVDNSKLTIQARPEFTNTDVVPVGFKAANAGQFTLSLHNKDGVFAQDQIVYIKDNLLGTITNITDGEYTFTAEAGTFNERFEIVYTTTALGTQSPELNAASVVVFKQGSAINITSGAAQINSVTVFDVRGRMLYNQSNVNASAATITNLQAAQEVLIVEVVTDRGTISKKIVY